MDFAVKSSFFLMLLLPSLAVAQRATIKGYVEDNQGERLPKAHVIILPDSTIGIADASGQFSIHTTTGEKRIQISYVGYQIFNQAIHLTSDTTFTIRLSSKANQLQEVTISGTKNEQLEIFESNQASKHVLTQRDINSIPVLGGEADVIKTLQLLPGTVRGIEGSSDLFVRGGAADQNLVLLDGAPIYNTSHLFGFLSVFNADVLDRVESINGGFPAEYGGRLSSILNVDTRSAIPDKTTISGDIGLIASRVFVEQPIVRNKASFWVAGRRTYIDQVIRAIGEELPYYFYDLNGKLVLQPNQKNEFELSHYSGEDLLDIFRDRNNDGRGFLTTYASGNSSQSFRWRRSFMNNWNSDVILMHTKYRYNVRNAFEENELIANSDIEDYGARVLLVKDSIGKSGTIKTGIDWTRHNVSPNVVNTVGSITELLKSSASSGQVADEFAIHTQYEWSPVERLRVNGGLRVSSAFVKNKNYAFTEPRISLRYALRKKNALKFSYSRMVQYIHRISNSAVSSPTDIWYPVTDSIQPQTSHQIALAWQRQITDDVFLSVEGYFKNMRQLIGYEEGTNLFLNTDFKSKLIQGQGKAYGLEVLLRKNSGKLTGWVSYTLSWSYRQFDKINEGRWFPSRYDRRHNGAVVAQYAFNKRWAFSMVWEFISGSRFTPVIGQYALLAPTLTGVDLIPVYSGINAVKLASSHRLDVGLKFKNKPDRKFQWQWFIGIYNVYNRANPIGISIEQNETDGSLRYTQPGLFGLIPFLNYGFRF